MEGISEEDLNRWQNSTADCFVNDLNRINDSFEEYHKFAHLQIITRNRIHEIFSVRFHESPRIREQILRFLRILARDQNNLDELLSGLMTRNVLSAARLTNQCFPFDWDTMIQAEMCLINLFFNSNLARNEFNEISSNLLLERIKLLNVKHTFDVCEESARNVSEDLCEQPFAELEGLHDEQIDLIAFYDLRIAFVASAHSKALQKQWLNNGCEIFLKILECSLGRTEALGENSRRKYLVERINWTLKILFNLFCYSQEETMANAKIAQQCMQLCSKIIIFDNVDHSLEQSAVDVMALIPLAADPLVPKLQPGELAKEVKVEYNGRDMTFADALLRALERRMEAELDEDTELLGTFLTVLIRLCTQVKEARRYLRLRIIPPLRAVDVKRHPDEGNELRNRMIRLMMNISNTRDLAAEFLFILCKRSVNRFVKYCGLGNAAGLLVNRGMLGALNAPKHLSDSEDSETEDYKSIEAQVNPVTGCIESPRTDPFEGMSDEHKEYEVHRLMNDISKLMNQGVITPGQIGEDGQLRPVKHVLELVKDADNKSDPESDND